MPERAGGRHLARLLFAAVLAVVALESGTAEPIAAWGPIPDDLWQKMQGRSWHARFDTENCERPEDCVCPPRESLALVSVPYRDFEGVARTGQLVVAASVAPDVAGVFEEIFTSGAFRIAAMVPVYRYDGSDDASMDANNTSAFNCRLTTGGSRLSSHAFGTAIDINPVQNPYVKGDTTLPPAGKAFDEAAERSAGHAGVIVKGDVVTTAFAKRDWSWGGEWESLKDYQHFSSDGR